MSEEEKKKKIDRTKDELSKSRDVYEKMIVWAKPAGPEPPTPQPEKKKSPKEEKSE